MPIVIPSSLPAYKTLLLENVAVMETNRAKNQDIRPLEILILNLMPLKVEAETQLLRLLSNTPLQVQVTFLRTKSYQGTHTPKEHLQSFYKTFEEIRERNYDGLIITGSPLEHLDFESVKYWPELREIFAYSQKKVTSVLHICWAAFAGLYYHFNINKNVQEKKRFGVFKHKINNYQDDLVRGLDTKIFMPHSCYAALEESDIKLENNLEVLVSSSELGSVIIKSTDNKNIFVTGHLEYDVDTLNQEYIRDINKGIDIEKPNNYYDENGLPSNNWRSSATLIFSNWLNYYVYQKTPYKLNKGDDI